jgi:hypothetical protein
MTVNAAGFGIAGRAIRAAALQSSRGLRAQFRLDHSALSSGKAVQQQPGRNIPFNQTSKLKVRMLRFAVASRGLQQLRLLCPGPPSQAFVEIQTGAYHSGRDLAQEGRTENVNTHVLQASTPQVEWWCRRRVRGYAASATEVRKILDLKPLR